MASGKGANMKQSTVTTGSIYALAQDALGLIPELEDSNGQMLPFSVRETLDDVGNTKALEITVDGVVFRVSVERAQ